jgi:arylsulfatase A-like enzyme
MKGGYVPTKYPRATYAAMITYLDKQVGRIIETLKKYQIDENTLIMFSSDNGATFDVGGVDTQFFNSVAGLRGRKQDLYEGGIREPMLARWPGKIKPDQTTDHPSAQFDVMATLADLTGAKIPVKTDGISFLPTLMGKSSKQKPHEFMYFEYPENGGQVAIRMGKWKGVRHNVRKNPDSPWELFNIDTDRNETKDLSTQYPEIVQAIKGIAKREHIHPHVMDWEFIDPKIKK